METVVRRGGGVGLLVSGSPLVLRSDYGLRATLMPPVTDANIRSLLDQLGTSPQETSRRVGRSVVEVGFGDTYRFQVTALGEPSARALLLVETKATVLRSPPPVRKRGGQRWLNSTWRQSLDDCLGGTTPESVWVPGCPPLMRGDAGFVAAAHSPLSESDFAEMVESLRQHRRPGESSDGFSSLDMRYGEHGHFTACIFGEPAPTLLLYLRWPDEDPDDPAGS